MEGVINSKLKNRKSKIKRLRLGFTLVEMTVVMGIISIMFLLGAYALISVRDQYIADQVVEELITQTRDAQNRSVSIQKDASGNSVKVWGVQITETFSNLISIGEAGPTYTTSNPYNYPSGLTVTNNPPSDSLYIYFASPFGKAYVSQDSCVWIESPRVTKEFETSECTPLKEGATISIDYKGNLRSLTVEPNGDIYAN